MNTKFRSVGKVCECKGQEYSELIFNQKESITILEIVSDCIDRGMVDPEYEIDKIRNLIEGNQDAIGNWLIEDVKMVVKVKRGSKSNL